MSTIALDLRRRSLVSACLLELRRRRGLVAVSALLTAGAMLVTYGTIEIMHLSDPVQHGPAGGVLNLGHGAWVASALGAVAAAVVAASAGSGDLEAGVYRELVVTGRPRAALYAARCAAGLLFLLPFVVAGYAVAAVASVAFAGGLAAPGAGLIATTGLWALLEVGFYYLVAFGIACLLGSRAYSIGIVLAWRLALTPILASISALGVARELVPGVALQNLTPAGLGGAASQGPDVPMSLAAIAAVLVVWAAAALLAGGWRDVSRDA